MRLLPTALSLLLLAPTLSAQADDPADDVIKPPAAAKFLIIPLRIHVLTADDLPEVDCKLTDADVRRIVGKVNDIWSKAGVHFGIESIVREPAEGQARFKDAKDKNGAAAVGLFRMLLPEPSRKFPGLHVYYIHQFAVNGIYMGDDFALVKETAKLRPVEGGIDEPIPRVTAHELGHALGLPHRQDRTNLLASGTTGTLLNAKEVARAREKALEIKGCSTVADLRQAADEAEKACDKERAKRLRGWVDEVLAKSSAEPRDAAPKP